LEQYLICTLVQKNSRRFLTKLEELFELHTGKKISLKFLGLMCKSNTAPKDMEEEELLH